MKNATSYARKLKSLLKKLSSSGGKAEVEGPTADPLESLVFAFLLWEATVKQAERAYHKLMDTVVDANDLRVSDPDETVAIIGERYPRAGERAERIKLSLNGIYLREHGMDVSKLQQMTKREAREYLDGLQGMVPFVSAHVMLIAIDGHAIPVDERLAEQLKEDGVVDPDADLDDIQSFLEHNIKAADARDAYALLFHYAEQGATARKSTRKSTGKKTTKKKSTKTKKKTTKRKTTSKKTTKKSTKKKTTKRTTRK